MTVAAAKRRMAGPTLLAAATLVAVSVFVGLGIWQIERKAWKEALIGTLEERLGARPVALPRRNEWQGLDPARDEFRRVTFRATILGGGEGRVYTSGSGLRADIKDPGYFAFAPARTLDGGIVVVDRGYVANPRPDASLRPVGLPDVPVDVVGVLRWPEQPSWFVTAHSQGEDLWFVRDPVAMAAAYGWGDVAPFYVDQESPAPPNGWPRPAPLTVKLRNEHLQYALTWFALASVVAIAFGVWFASRPRETERSSPRRPRASGDP